ncbi:MAG: GNAT family N-acetyltransferase, partial [Bdellovibrionales bacterium]|nr:GNAT family N-acetyltransferase [Bdellovibrionales bacterium]
GRAYQEGMRQRIFELRQVNNIPLSSGKMRVATEKDLPVVKDFALGFYRDCFPNKEQEKGVALAESMVAEGTCYLWEDQKPVAMVALRRPTTHGICISYVYTPPEERGKGYASTVVATVSRQCLEGKYDFCTLYTDAENPTSNSIYLKIGYKIIGEVMDVEFEASPGEG